MSLRFSIDVYKCTRKNNHSLEKKNVKKPFELTTDFKIAI
jgi:hypothetical protein